ncbi:hypothetical protein GPECTOR_99g818 [Gonium pectorale]|uniref:Uncharacterized protein n=1 Tax=Gonium pectorale TaxID=33097 RepID=A0A150FZX9_GONPE|nr:hypothetical protein GPECTOR_99g818 [Gonium pectorale]|eukprot:KXZ43183.1 hypothetical protein GPECTOR_99g818 [Gonium pectorale]
MLQGSGAACATLKKQQVPVSFTPAPIPELNFDVPKARKVPSGAASGGNVPTAVAKVKITVPVAIGNLAELEAQLTKGLAYAFGHSAGQSGWSEEQGNSPSAVQPQSSASSSSSDGEQAAVAATAKVEPAAKHRAANGVEYFVCGDPKGAFDTIVSLTQQRKQQLLAADAEASLYFGTPQHMFYYAEGSIGISISGGSVTFFYPRSLRDHSATINLITWRMVKAYGLPVRPTTKRLSTGADQVEVTHELAHEQLSVCLLPGSRHAVRLPMTETLVVKDTPLFDFLASNPQMHVVADFVTTYPVPQLHFRPNVLEHPELLVTILMRNAPGVRPAAAPRTAGS